MNYYVIPGTENVNTVGVNKSVWQKKQMPQENSPLKSEYIAKIESISNSSFNREQKEIAKKIISNCDERDLHNVFNLITQRIKTGFVFDAAPEINHDAVALVKEWKELNINSPVIARSEATKQSTLDKEKSNELFETPIEHTLIIGENYDALKNLCATYIDKSGKGLVDVIYIDPPYNTDASKADGNDYKEQVESNKFIYRDKFTRDGWLNMMNERLKLARKLLSDKGVIFISIDDSEQAYLKVLCDEIFGEENFVANLCVNSAPAGTQSSNFFAQQHSYCLVYVKNINNNNLSKIELSTSELEKKYSEKDEYGNYYIERVWKRGIGGRKEDVPSLHFPVYYDENKNTIYIDDEKPENMELVKIIPYQTVGVLGRWTWSKEKMRTERYKLIVKKTNGEYKLYKKNYAKDEMGKLPKSIITSDIARTELGSLELKGIMCEKVFDYPKPVSLIKHLLKIATPKMDCHVADAPRNDESHSPIILDFFAGSGTTGQAVMELNAEDGGKRKAILVTNNENSIGEKITCERLYRVINGKGSNGESISWKYSENQPCLNNNSVRVFKIENHQLTLNDLQKAEELKESAKIEFKKLNPAYDTSNDFDIYNELASLNPYKEQPHGFVHA